MYLHGGISPKFLSVPVATMNKTIRTELADPSKLPPGMTTNVEGPLWYRGLSEGNEHELASHVRAILRTFGVKRIVVGHTVTRSAIMPRFGSSVLNIDIGLSKFYKRPPACLVIEKWERGDLAWGYPDTCARAPRKARGLRISRLSRQPTPNPQSFRKRSIVSILRCCGREAEVSRPKSLKTAAKRNTSRRHKPYI